MTNELINCELIMPLWYFALWTLTTSMFGTIVGYYVCWKVKKLPYPI